MDTLRSAAHLQRELGDELFAAIVDSDNTAVVRKFAEDLVRSGLPSELTIGGVTYDVLAFLKPGEKYVKGDVMIARAKEMGAHQGREEREHLLKHEGEIPEAFRRKVVFVFTGDRHPDDPESIYLVYWGGGCWVGDWDWLDNDWYDDCRVLRRKSA